MVGIGNLNPTLPDAAYSKVTFKNGLAIREGRMRNGVDSRGANTGHRRFYVSGTDDFDAARTALEDSDLPIDTFDGLYKEQYERTQVAPETWRFDIDYSDHTPNVKLGHYVTSIDTTGGQILQTYGYAANSTFPATGETATDFGNAINVQDGVAKGVSRVIPAMKISITAKIATEYVVRPFAYAKLCRNLTGFTNSTAMFQYQESPALYEFEVGELLFLGARGTIRAANPQLTFDFLAGENLSSFDVGDISGITKKAHQFIWYEFRTDQDATTKRQIQKAVAAHVGTVYGEADLTALEIGTLPTT